MTAVFAGQTVGEVEKSLEGALKIARFSARNCGEKYIYRHR